MGHSPQSGGFRVRRRAAAWLCLGVLLVRAVGAEPDVRRDAVVTAVERVMPTVVNIATEEIVEQRDPFEAMFREFWGPYYRRRPPNTQYSLGSGVIIHEDGYVLTNLHVVRRAKRVWVKLADGREFEARPIVGTTRSDVALLKLVAQEGAKFTAVRFGRDDDLLLGETVLALGNPFGLGGSVSRGILSSKNRRAAKDDEPLDVADWLQTDAPINFGNSGGPLINLRGELIGLNVAVHKEGQGIGFAIPIRQVNEALAEIFIPEVTQSLWFGARIKTGPGGLAVAAVAQESPAARAGLREGDDILQVNGRTPGGLIECVEAIGASPRREARLLVKRGAERREVTVRMPPLADVVRQKLGLSVQEVTRELSERFGFEPRSGLLIADVEAGGPAAAAELRPGWLLAGIAGETTPDLLSAADALSRAAPGQRLTLEVVGLQQRGGVARLNRGSATVRVR